MVIVSGCKGSHNPTWGTYDHHGSSPGMILQVVIYKGNAANLPQPLPNLPRSPLEPLAEVKIDAPAAKAAKVVGESLAENDVSRGSNPWWKMVEK